MIAIVERFVDWLITHLPWKAFGALTKKFVPRNKLLAATSLFVQFVAVASGAQDTLAFRGTIATQTGFLDDATLVVESGTIRSIGKNAILSPGTTVIDVGGIIFPGLIDLHDHLTWNIFPRWRLPRPVGDRYE